jgi:hypothetical protein
MIFWIRTSVVRVIVVLIVLVVVEGGRVRLDPDRGRLRRRRGDLAGLDRGGQVGVDLLGARQLRELVQPEAHEEVGRRLVEEGASHDGLLARRRDQLLLEQRLQHARGVHAADVLDLGHRDGLAVRDDRQRLEGRERKPAALGHLVELAQQRIELGARDEAPSAGHLLDPDAPLFHVGPRDERGQRLRHRRGRRIEQLREVFLADGPGRGEQDGFDRRQDLLPRGFPADGLDFFGDGVGCGGFAHGGHSE